MDFKKITDGDAEGFITEGPPEQEFGYRICLRCGVRHREVRAQFCQPCRGHIAELGYPARIVNPRD